MTPEKLIDLLAEAGMLKEESAGVFGWKPTMAKAEKFAALVAAEERNRTWTKDHWTEYEQSIAAAEREECAKVCDRFQERDVGMQPAECAGAIRARGQS
jgi:hypothetical protein